MTDARAVPDAETMVIQFLTAALGDAADVASDMPVGYGDVIPIRPFVWINALPGGQVAKAWQGRTFLWMVTLDYDTFDTEHDSDSARGNALMLGRLVAANLPGIISYVSDFGQATRCEVYTPSIRPDWNDRVRRYGGTTQVWVKAAQSAG